MAGWPNTDIYTLTFFMGVEKNKEIVLTYTQKGTYNEWWKTTVLVSFQSVQVYQM